MKIVQFFLLVILILNNEASANSWIRINQLGYEPDAIKVAVLISEEKIIVKNFQIVDAISGKIVFKSSKVKETGEWYKFKSSFRLDFSNFNHQGVFYVQAGQIKSDYFRIHNGIYNNLSDFLLQYLRQQQCGYNPFLKDSCHTQDGFIIYHPEKSGQYIDVVGGWHDASDYLRYVTTSATTTFQLLFAYYQNPDVFNDEFDKNGNPGSDGIPDVLNCAKWGLDWLLKMNPSKDEMYNQVADDRDHLGFRLPTEDTVNYGMEKGRPVYFVNGEPQGLFRFKNRTTGVSSTAAKFASVFAFASSIFQFLPDDLRNELLQESIDAYNFAKLKPGVCQTAPCRAPYFYEEENYFDDMALASSVLNYCLKDSLFLNEAIEYLRAEPVVPWIDKDTAQHYQWYPFINPAHYFIFNSVDKELKKEISNYYNRGLKFIEQKSLKNPFRIGVPFIWCSNNLIASVLIQFRLYQLMTNDDSFIELEAAHRDWLFGCNPWGTSMIVGIPSFGDFPEDPHSAFSALYGYPVNGGLVDGPVYTSIYKNLIGIKLHRPDEYEKFQTDFIVYHDDYGDYSTNEPTLDGTASLVLYLSFLHNLKINSSNKNCVLDQGGIVRFDTTQKKIYLIFSAHEFGEGLAVIRETLKRNNIKASFFFTGKFLRQKKNHQIIKNLIKDGNLIGPHSNEHLLYCDWNNRDSLLITREEFFEDLRKNLLELQKFGLSINSIKYFLPPFEWYNQKIASWTQALGLQLINFTPSSFTNADYTTPDMENYQSSDIIIQKLYKKIQDNPDELNGAILLIHSGTHPSRKDKLYNKLDELIKKLKSSGYQFDRLN